MSTTPMKIALFQCRWCLYSPEDQAWVDNDLPENIHLVRVPCTGRIDPLFILNAVQGGADGVMISGCLPEKCHFKEGNLAARRQLVEFSQFLDYIGYAQDRGRIQRELAAFESALEQLDPAQTLATRAPAATGGTHD